MMTNTRLAETHDGIRDQVRQHYGQVALRPGGGCCTPAAGGASCSGTATDAARLGYTAADSAAVPAGADLGLGCGNPTAFAALRPGEVVLDLGSGAGFDCFLAAQAVGPAGHVIGVDMTPEMLGRARANAARGGYAQVEFRLGEIEALPVADASVDVVIANCVLNLSPDKARVAREAFRVLRPGGRLAVSDPVRTGELPPELLADAELYSACAAGAASVADWEAWLAAAGFTDIRITPQDGSREFIREWAPGTGVENSLVSANLEAVKPKSLAEKPAQTIRPR